MKHTLYSKAVGCMLVLTGILLFFILFPYALFSLGLFAAWLMIWPISFVASLGFCLIQQERLKRSMINWLIAVALISIPWAYVCFIRLTVESKILTISFLAVTSVLLYYFYLRHKFHEIIDNLRKKRDSKPSIT